MLSNQEKRDLSYGNSSLNYCSLLRVAAWYLALADRRRDVLLLGGESLQGLVELTVKRVRSLGKNNLVICSRRTKVLFHSP